jgi:hypothetical protein
LLTVIRYRYRSTPSLRYKTERIHVCVYVYQQVSL